jgi:hypothetical protein
MATVCHDLGILGYPDGCNKIQFLRNLTCLSTDELNVATELKEPFMRLELQGEELLMRRLGMSLFDLSS